MLLAGPPEEVIANLIMLPIPTEATRRIMTGGVAAVIVPCRQHCLAKCIVTFPRVYVKKLANKKYVKNETVIRCIGPRKESQKLLKRPSRVYYWRIYPCFAILCR